MSLAAGGILMLTVGDVVEGETGIDGGLGEGATRAGSIVRVGGSGLRSDDRPKKYENRLRGDDELEGGSCCCCCTSCFCC